MPSKRSAAVLLVAVLAAGPALAQGIPVFDASNTAQAIEQVRQGVQQLRQLQAQVTQAQQLYQSLNQISNIGDVAPLLGNPTLRQYLPPEFSQLQGVLTANTTDDYLNLADRAADLYDQNSVKSADDYYRQELARIGTRSAGETSLAQQIYDAANERLQGLQQLQAKVADPSNDARAVADLQARIQAEQALIANDQMRLQGLAMLQQAQIKMDEVRAEQARRANAQQAVDEYRQQSAAPPPPVKTIWQSLDQ
ncbi:MAG: P-type DNA transfer protein VirB5 [Inquilinus sp.]|uniref:P-type DNA transfer protein VirB5 n=1 Tax=Inquilinus sp. TaxID=1932117 RepID=UPI003F3F4114